MADAWSLFHLHQEPSLIMNVGNLEDPGVDGRIILKWIFERLGVGAWTGPIWLRIGTGGELLCIR
jgi:hypothetical protein